MHSEVMVYLSCFASEPAPAGAAEAKRVVTAAHSFSFCVDA
jgi:hypothetical protein